MEAGIVGLTATGKTALFNALTAAGADEAAGYARPNVGIARVPDERLNVIHQFIDTRKIVPATIRLVDIAGLAPGGEGAGNRMLAEIRNVDAIVHVVRGFDAGGGKVDPLGDIETVDLELMAADQKVVVGALDKARKQARTGDKEALARVAALEKCEGVLSDLQPVRAVEFTDAEAKDLRSLGLITAKSVLYIANIGENEVGREDQSQRVQQVRRHAEAHGGRAVAVCAKLEAELAELDQADRDEMLESLDMAEPALPKVAQAIYDLLGLQSFYTAGPKEIRAWPVEKGATVRQAAGVIHSDIERGFIRAEVYHADDLVEHKSEAAIRSAGKLRIEGKDYRVSDGDVCHMLFNV